MARLSDANDVFTVLGCPLFIVSFFLLSFSLAPIASIGWTAAVTYLPVQNCAAVPSCIDGTVRFRIQSTPFYVTQVFTMGTSEVQRVAWTDLNSKDVCAAHNELTTGFANPLGMCSSNDELQMPSAIATVQAVSVLAILMCIFASVFSIIAVSCAPVRYTVVYHFLCALALSFAGAALGVWNNVPHQAYMTGKITVAPVWNVTLQYQGQVYVRTKYSGRWEDVYSFIPSTTIVPSPPLMAVSTAPGYSLWIAGLSFIVIAQALACIGCLCRVKKSCDNSGGGFGSGTYRPVDTPLGGSTATPISFPPEAERPNYPPPPPPTDALKKDW